MSFGPLFENREGLKRLEAEGLGRVDSLDEISPEQTVAIPVWGIPTEDLSALRAQGLRILNTTCPRDSLSHNLAYRLAREGYGVIIVGRPGSPPAQSLLSRVEKGRQEQMETLGEGGAGRAFSGAVIDATQGRDPDLRRIPEDVTHAAIVAQANVSLEAYQAVVAKAATRFEEVRAYNTVCPSLAARFQEACKLAESCSAMLIVGDPNIETDELAHLCSRGQTVDTFVVPSLDDLPQDLHEQHSTIGVVSSTSTPDWLLVSVVEELRRGAGACVEEGPATG